MRAVRDVVVGLPDARPRHPGFERAAARIAIAGIYNLRIHHDDVLQPVLRHLKVLEIDGLGPEGLQRPGGTRPVHGRPERPGQRFDERREALLARRRARS